MQTKLDEIRSLFQRKTRRNLEGNFVSCQPIFRRNFGEPRENSSTSRVLLENSKLTREYRVSSIECGVSSLDTRIDTRYGELDTRVCRLERVHRTGTNIHEF